MKPVFQDKFGKPDGNCFAACVASILELDYIPDINGNDDRWWFAVNEFLQPFGLFYLEFKVNHPDGELTLDMIPGFVILVGPGPRGINHAVVGLNGKIIHDPHPDGGGIDVENCGMFVAINPIKVQHCNFDPEHKCPQDDSSECTECMADKINVGKMDKQFFSRETGSPCHRCRDIGVCKHVGEQECADFVDSMGEGS